MPGVVNKPSKLTSELNSAPPQLIDTATTPGWLLA
jgi:hypothetical protein